MFERFVSNMSVLPDDESPSKVWLFSVFPNFKALDVDTTFHVYREFRIGRNLVELTVFYREPDKRKVRVDAEIESSVLEAIYIEHLGPQHVKIVQVGEATQTIRQSDDK